MIWEMRAFIYLIFEPWMAGGKWLANSVLILDIVAGIHDDFACHRFRNGLFVQSYEQARFYSLLHYYQDDLWEEQYPPGPHVPDQNNEKRAPCCYEKIQEARMVGDHWLSSRASTFQPSYSLSDNETLKRCRRNLSSVSCEQVFEPASDFLIDLGNWNLPVLISQIIFETPVQTRTTEQPACATRYAPERESILVVW